MNKETKSKEQFIKRLDWFIPLGLLLFLFIMLIEVVGLDRVANLDRGVTSGVAAARQPFLNSIFLFITTIGNTTTLIIFTVTMALYLIFNKVRIHWVIWFVLLVFLGGVIINPMIKVMVQRTRPDEAFRLLEIHSYSFPSGHSLSTIVCFGGLAYLIGQVFYPDRQRMKKNLMIAAVVLSLLIAFSRVYLGVHYLTDIVAGYLLGTCLLLFFIKLTKTLPLFEE